MSLTDKVNNGIKEAMKARNKIRLESLRNIKKVLIEARAAKGKDSELSMDEELKIVQKLVKQGKDSASIYKQQGRDDLYGQEMAQVQIFETFLPEKIGKDELIKIVKEIITSTGASDIKDMGKVMGIASKKLAGRAEGKEIAALVRELLG